MGYKLFVGPEPEFFLFKTDENGEPIIETNDKWADILTSPPSIKVKLHAKTSSLLSNRSGLKSKLVTMNAPLGNMKLIFKYDDALVQQIISLHLELLPG